MNDLERLSEENRALRGRLAEAEDVVRAIRSGEVDAVVVDTPAGERVFTLRDADRPYRVLVESMHEGAATLIPPDTVGYANRRLAELLGVPLERLVGSDMREWLPEEAREAFAQLRERARSGGAWGEVELRRADGRLLPALLSFAPTEMNEVRAVSLVVTDLSETKERAELAALTERLREADHRKDQFLATLAHELRNPLAAIRASLELGRRLDPADHERHALAREIAERQLSHLTLLVDDLLDVSRIITGQVRLKRARVQLGEVIERAIETSRPLLDERAHRLVVDVPPGPLAVDGDEQRLAQAIASLLQNAAKFTPEGCTVWISLESEAQELRVRVRDSGVGIASDALPHVFDLFTQGPRSLDRAEGGLGIGLTLVRRLVELHGGSVEAASAGPGTGAEFTVRLPAADPLPVSEPPPERPTVVAERRRVLVVDDNVDAARSLGLLLELSGYDVRCVHEGASALAVARELVPEILLLDIGLPGLDGYAVARALRSDPRFERTLLLAISGYGSAEDRRRSHESGFDLHLVKPVDIAELEALLSTWISARPALPEPEATGAEDESR